MFSRFRKIVVLMLILSSVQVSAVYAQNAQELCIQDTQKALASIMTGGNGIRGYLQRMGDLTSSNRSPHLLINEIEQLVRDAHIEMEGVCQAVSAPEQLLDAAMQQAYGLQSCVGIAASTVDLNFPLQNSVECRAKADAYKEQLLSDVSSFLLKQSVRTSAEPLTIRMRSLNARLEALVPQYGRLVKSFFTFRFRLGDFLITDPD